MEDYSTLSEAMDSLKNEGYINDLNLYNHCPQCRNGRFDIVRNELKLDKYSWFDVLPSFKIKAIFMLE